MCFSRISPEPLELQKFFLHLFASLYKKLSSNNKMSNPVAKSADMCKNAVLPEKVSHWKKSAILKKSKTFFHGSKVYALNLHTNKFSAQKSSRNLFKSS